MSHHRVLLKGGTILTLDRAIGNFAAGDLLIEGTKIADIGSDLSGVDAEVVDAAGMIVMPGFVDTHRHNWEGILRNIGVDVPLEGDHSYLAIVLNVLAPSYRPDDVYTGGYATALGAIDAGITTILDWSHIQITPDHTEGAIKALQDSGIRAVFAYGNPWYKDPDPEQWSWFQQTAADHFASKDQLITYALATPGPEFMPLDATKAHWELARRVDARITAHVGVGSFGKHGKVLEAGREGIYGADTTFIHCTTLSDDEIQMIVDTGSSVSLASPVEMMMGHGMVPTQKFLDRGLRPSLSVDVETNVPNDMFTQMRSVASLQRAMLHDRRLEGEEDLPEFLNARDMLELATIEGARANGLEQDTGTLTPGKEADVIMLATNRINVMPINDPIGAVAWGMDTSNVDSVWVAGRPLKRNGELVDVDLAKVEDMVYASRDHVVGDSGFTLPSIDR
jgi:5-methylthioadenosine/S-adenosylhomocysteine deaminase